jgi:hypothetical protein
MTKIEIKIGYIFFSTGLAMFFCGYILMIAGSDGWLRSVPAEYFFNYRFEFIKRGIVGEIIRIFGWPVTRERFFLFAVMMYFFLLFSWWIYFNRTLKDSSNKIRNFFLLLFLISPATCIHFGYDFGRLEQINIALTFICILLVKERKIAFLAPIVIFSFFNHEAFVFIGFPMISAVAYYTYSNNKEDRRFLWTLLFNLVVSIFAFLFVVSMGSFERIDIEEFTAYIANNIENYRQSGHLVPFATLESNVNFTLKKYSEPKTWGQIFNVSTYFLLVSALYVRLFFHDLKFNKFLVLISPFAVLPLFFLGIDFYRWIALIVVQIFAVSAFFINDLTRLKASKISVSLKIHVIFIMCFSFFGPIGVTCAFPLFEIYPSLKGVIPFY